MMRVIFAVLLFAAQGGALAAQPPCAPRSPEAFDTFMARFQEDRQFAMERTAVPLEALVFSPGIEVNKGTPSRAYSTLDQIRKEPLLGDFIRENGMSVDVKRVRSKVDVQVFKDGTDWMVTYRFRLRRGCWQFWQTETWEY